MTDSIQKTFKNITITGNEIQLYIIILSLKKYYYKSIIILSWHELYTSTLSIWANRIYYLWSILIWKKA
jgi:hypothetical protein